MTTQTIFFFAMGVFGLMLVGIVLTIFEFYRLTDDPSTRKGVGAALSMSPLDFRTLSARFPRWWPNRFLTFGEVC